jgi:hypothetical protein
MKRHLILHEATEMRAKGYSYKQIAKKLNISHSTAFEWTKNIELNESALRRLSSRVADARYRSGYTQHLSKQKTLDIIKRQQKEYLESLKTDKSNQLLCAMIYWCEGAKSDEAVTFTNSDPALIAKFLFLLRNSFTLDESKFRVGMHLHSYHNEEMQRTFWSNITQIPESQFIKTFHKQNSGKVKRHNYPGCISVRYHDCLVARSLLELAKLYMNESHGECADARAGLQNLPRSV